MFQLSIASTLREVSFVSLTATTAGPTTTSPQPPPQQCDALDQLIANRDVSTTGNCSRNAGCNMVDCLDTANPGVTTTIMITFPPTPSSPCTVRSRIVTTISNRDPIIIDVTVSGDRSVQLPSPIDATINLLFTRTADGISYGVSGNNLRSLSIWFKVFS